MTRAQTIRAEKNAIVAQMILLNHSAAGRALSSAEISQYESLKRRAEALVGGIVAAESQEASDYRETEFLCRRREIEIAKLR